MPGALPSPTQYPQFAVPSSSSYPQPQYTTSPSSASMPLY
jgi:hypothetical protein